MLGLTTGSLMPSRAIVDCTTTLKRLGVAANKHFSGAFDIHVSLRGVELVVGHPIDGDKFNCR